MIKKNYFKCYICDNIHYKRPSQLKRIGHCFCSLKCFHIFALQNFSNIRHKKIYKEYIQYKKYLKSLNKETLAWLAGFWEGEGYLRIANKISLSFVITQNEKHPFIFIKKFLKAGQIYKEDDIYRYIISKTGINLALIENIKPFARCFKRKRTIKKSLKILSKLKCIK